MPGRFASVRLSSITLASPAFLPMRHFSIFCVLLLQTILFAQPAISQLDNDRIHKAFVDAGLLPNEGVIDFGYHSVAQPLKHCSNIKYPLETISFLVDICFDKSSQELDAKLKVGDDDLGQAKGTFDGGVLISFDHGKYLNGHHRYYVKGNELRLRYSNMILGKNHNGDFKLRSLDSTSLEASGTPQPGPKRNASKSLLPSEDSDAHQFRSKEYEPKPEPKEEKLKTLIFPEDSAVSKSGPKDDAKPGHNEDGPKPRPNEDVMLEPNGDEPRPGPKKVVLKSKPKGKANKPKSKEKVSKPKSKGKANKPKSKGKASKPKPKRNATKPKLEAEL